jgi:hypothetical protein
MARAKTKAPQRLCWDCIFSKPFEAEWNRDPQGNPITYHCHKDPDNIKRGLMDNTAACIDFKPRR